MLLERPLEVAADSGPVEREGLLEPFAERAGGAGQTRETDDFDVNLAACSSAEPTGSCVRR